MCLKYILLDIFILEVLAKIPGTHIEVKNGSIRLDVIWLDMNKIMCSLDVNKSFV